MSQVQERAVSTPVKRGPLVGVRVVEFGGFAAGPVVGKHLANYGAEVIRVESRTRLDGFRTHYPPYKDNVPGIERAGIFSFFNDGKRSITLNLKTAKGVSLAQRLVAAADVVVENFTPGTITRLGLGYEQMAALNPRLVMLSTCNQGQYGPHATHPGFGSQLTSLSGFTHYLGYRDGAPVLLYGPYIDYIAVGYGTAAVLAALIRRQRTGRGAYIDLSQYEGGLQFLAPALLDLQVNGRVTGRDGNRHATAAPHGVFRCSGEEQWVALSVHDDQEWSRFVEALGGSAWARDPALVHAPGRKAHEECLEAEIGAWTAKRTREDVVQTLRHARVHVYPVLSMQGLFEDAQLEHRGHWRAVGHPVLGRVRVAAPPALLTDTPPTVEGAAPLLGADTERVLHDVLGLTPAEIEDLNARGALT